MLIDGDDGDGNVFIIDGLAERRRARAAQAPRALHAFVIKLRVSPADAAVVIRARRRQQHHSVVALFILHDIQPRRRRRRRRSIFIRAHVKVKSISV